VRRWIERAAKRGGKLPGLRWRDLADVALAARLHPEGERRALLALARPGILVVEFAPWVEKSSERLAYILRRREGKVSLVVTDVPPATLAKTAPGLAATLEGFAGVRCTIMSTRAAASRRRSA
jgi:hypothetical protein